MLSDKVIKKLTSMSEEEIDEKLKGTQEEKWLKSLIAFVESGFTREAAKRRYSDKKSK